MQFESNNRLLHMNAFPRNPLAVKVNHARIPANGIKLEQRERRKKR